MEWIKGSDQIADFRRAFRRPGSLHSFPCGMTKNQLGREWDFSSDYRKIIRKDDKRKNSNGNPPERAI
jgi:hypothetical protein